MKRLVIDIETRSHSDLPKDGAYRYAEDPSTEVRQVGFKIDDDPVQVWQPWQDGLMPVDLLDALIDPDCTDSRAQCAVRTDRARPVTPAPRSACRPASPT